MSIAHPSHLLSPLLFLLKHVTFCYLHMLKVDPKVYQNSSTAVRFSMVEDPSLATHQKSVVDILRGDMHHIYRFIPSAYLITKMPPHFDYFWLWLIRKFSVVMILTSWNLEITKFI
jgi:hypothetical protein